jgi:hypothetical protein
MKQLIFLHKLTAFYQGLEQVWMENSPTFVKTIVLVDREKVFFMLLMNRMKSNFKQTIKNF